MTILRKFTDFFKSDSHRSAPHEYTHIQHNSFSVLPHRGSHQAAVIVCPFAAWRFFNWAAEAWQQPDIKCYLHPTPFAGCFVAIFSDSSGVLYAATF